MYTSLAIVQVCVSVCVCREMKGKDLSCFMRVADQPRVKYYSNSVELRGQ